MKKTILIVILCVLLLCITACGITRGSIAAFGNTMEFASGEEMLNHLAGMWVVDDDAEEKSYYIFRDRQIYITTDTMYSEQVKQMLDKALQNGGLEALYYQNFANVSKRMYLSDVSITPDTIGLFPQNGEIKLYEGQYNEKSIVITKESVLLMASDTEKSTVMTKISDAADFSMKRFEEIYNEVTENYAVPTSQFWLDTKEYGEMVKTKISSFDWWSLAPGSDSKVEPYVPPKELTTLKGSLLLIKKEELVLTHKVNVSSWDNSWEPSFTILYSPESGYLTVADQDNNALNLLSLVQYGVYAVQNFPGAYTDPVELYNAIANTELVSSDDKNKKELTINGLTYTLYVGTDGTWGMLDVRAQDTIFLSDILENTQEKTENTEPEPGPTRSGTLEQLLDGTKSWVAPWEFDGWEYNVHFVFKEDGTCYFALSELEVFDAGMGTYTVKDGKTLSLSLKLSGKKYSATYDFDPENFSLTVTSMKGIVGEKGEVFYFTEDTELEAEIVEDWGRESADGIPEDDEGPWS